VVFGYLLFFDVFLAVATAAIIMRVRSSQNRASMFCVAWIVVSSSIFWCLLLLSVLLCLFMDVFSR